MRRIAFLIGCFLLFMLSISGTASAASIFEHQNTVVPSDQTVDDVYVVGGDVEILGHVTGIVVVINGHLHVAASASIDGMIVVAGGSVDQDPGAVIGDDIYDLSLDGATQNSLLIGGGLMIGLWVVQLIGTILLILLPMLISLAGKKKTKIFIDRFAVQSFGRLLFTGFLSAIALAALSTLLLITIVGIPVLIGILLIVVIAFLVGITVLSYRIGEQFRGAAHKPDWLKIMLGSMLVAAVVNIPLFGWIVLLLLVLMSLGICIEWLAAARKRR